jgi:hypothetical protein
MEGVFGFMFNKRKLIKICEKNARGMLAAIVLSIGMVPGVTNAKDIPERPAHIIVDGQPLQLTALVQNDRLLVPAIFFKAIGVEVNWSTNYQSVILKKKNRQISLPSGKKYADFTSSSMGTWQRDLLSTTTVDQQDGTYIPLRYAVEKMGFEVTYYPEKNTVYINSHTTGSLNKKEDLKWLYQITEAEAGGESHQGKVAVASTVLNRVKSPDWANSINNVTFQVVQNKGVDYYQYSPVQDGRIYQVKPSEDTVKAVNEALQGTDPTHGATVFYNPEKTDNQWVRSKPVVTTIGNHIFAR